MSQENFRNLVDATRLLQDIRDGKFEGKEALEKLAATKEFVFHGSPENIEILEPRQAMNEGKPHGKPGISTAPGESYELAIFMALVNSRKISHCVLRALDIQAFQSEGDMMAEEICMRIH